MSPLQVSLSQTPFPIVGDVLAFTMLGSLHSMNVVADLVKEHHAEQKRPNHWQSQRPRRSVLQRLVDEELDPSLLSLPGSVVEAGNLGVPCLPTAPPAPTAPSPTGQCCRVRENYRSEARQVLLRHVGNQVRNSLPSIAGRPEVLVGFHDVDHAGTSLSRETTAASNKELKLTKHGQLRSFAA
jgi:hypothetical protein